MGESYLIGVFLSTTERYLPPALWRAGPRAACSRPAIPSTGTRPPVTWALAYVEW